MAVFLFFFQFFLFCFLHYLFSFVSCFIFLFFLLLGQQNYKLSVSAISFRKLKVESWHGPGTNGHGITRAEP